MNGSSRALEVWMNGENVGVWYASRAGTSVFQYDARWPDSPRTRPLSLSLPILPGNQPHRGEVVDAWFDNLLPDSNTIRERLRGRFRARSLQAFELLAAIGRDCVGAVQIVPEGQDPGNVRRIDASPLDDAAVAKLLRGVTVARRLGVDENADEFRISIAGAQEKTALLRQGTEWFQPHGATPTTHILKLPRGLIGNVRANVGESVENEWACMHLLREFGLPVADTEIAHFRGEVSEEKALIVTRFDRQVVDETDSERRWIVRLPQEDFCQATGTNAAQKYESDGGPGIPKCLELIAASEQPRDDAVVFTKAQLAFWLLAASDGHAKNFSIFLRRHGYRLTPLYDVLSAWPIIGTGPNEWPYQDVKLAMAIQGSRPYRKLNSIAVRHWRKLAEKTGDPSAFLQMTAMVERANVAVDTVGNALPRGFPEQVWSRISSGVLQHRRRFLDGLSAHQSVD